MKECMAKELRLTEVLVSHKNDMLQILTFKEEEGISGNDWEAVKSNKLLYVKKVELILAEYVFPDSNVKGTGKQVAIPRKWIGAMDGMLELSNLERETLIVSEERCSLKLQSRALFFELFTLEESELETQKRDVMKRFVIWKLTRKKWMDIIALNSVVMLVVMVRVLLVKIDIEVYILTHLVSNRFILFSKYDWLKRLGLWVDVLIEHRSSRLDKN